MAQPPKTRRAADHLVDLLAAQGTTHVFGVPGESFLPVLDALHQREGSIAFVTCRQEGGAAMAADAHGKLTGRPGVCMVTRGPGATNASAGVHVAYQDSTPMILFIGQVARSMIEREAFQEIDYRRMFGQMAKWTAQIEDASRLQEYISRAYHVAMSARPCPVVYPIPQDMLYDVIETPPAPAYITPPKSAPDGDQMAALTSLLSQAKTPMIMAGGGGWTDAGRAALAEFAERQGVPVTVSLRCQSLIDNDHPNYAGHFGVAPTPYLARALEQTDVLIAIGPRLGEMTTQGYTLLTPPVPAQKLVHVFPAGEELGRVYQPTLAFAADVNSFSRALAQLDPIDPTAQSLRTAQLRQDYLDYSNPASVMDDPMADMFAHLTQQLPKDAILCNGAGNYAGWLHRFYKYRAAGSQLAPTSGSMGYGLPAAVAAAITQPTREVYAIAGDGCFMMTCQEMATAAHFDVNLTVIVVNNNRLGTIRAHQEREYPGRVSGTGLTNPDFVGLAQSFGAMALKADDLDSFKQALAQTRAHKGLSLIEVVQDPTILAPGKRL